MSVGMTGYRMTGRHRRTETASNNDNTVILTSKASQGSDSDASGEKGDQ